MAIIVVAADYVADVTDEYVCIRYICLASVAKKVNLMETSKSSSNPYVYDQPVTGENFFGREKEIQQIEKALYETGRGVAGMADGTRKLLRFTGSAVIIVGQHRIGKTSLLLELQNHLNPDQFIAVYLDARKITGAKRPSEIWFYIAMQIARHIEKIRDPNDLGQEVSTLLRVPLGESFDDDGVRFQKDFLQSVYKVLWPNQRLIVLFDEAESVRSLFASQSDLQKPFLDGLHRLIVEEPELGFVFAFTRSDNVYDLLNNADVFPLSVLEREAASRLITSPSENIHYDPSAIERIVELTNGHPFFTQLLCHQVFTRIYTSSTGTEPIADLLAVDTSIREALQNGETIFEGIWKNLSSTERLLVASLVDVLSAPTAVANPNDIFKRLGSKDTSLVEGLRYLAVQNVLEESQGGYRFLVPLFGLWVKERKPLQQTIEESKAQESAQQTEQRKEVLVNFALNDRPVGEDKLGYDDYAKAFAQVLANPDTKTPLTIGIYGSWGMGKSFLMEKIKEQLKKVKGEIEEDRKNKGLKNKDYPDFHFVHFNAWVYSGSENLWAGLVTKLYSEVEKCFGRFEVSRRLLWENILGVTGKTLGLLAVYGLLGFLFSVLLNYNRIQTDWESLRLAINALASAGLGVSALAALPSLLKAIRDLSSSVVLMRSEQLAALSSRKDFRDKIGFMADIKTEIGRIGKMLNAGKDGRPVRFVIFIDDLDRCPPAKAVEVLEAIMLLLADDDGIPFIIFLGIDARVIVKAIEDRYGKVLVEAGITGYEYLDKIVQIPFRIPPANEEALKNYVESLLWRSDKERKEAKEIKEKREKEERERKEKEETEKKAKEVKQDVAPKIESGEAVVAAAASSQTQTEGAGAVAASPDQKPPAQNDQVVGESPKIPEIKIQSIEVPFKDEEQTAFKDFSRYYTPNPRRIKRIVNIYRIVRLLADEQDAEFRRKMIKWVILSEQWPYRVAWVLQKIEDEYQLSRDLGATLSLWSVFESVQQRVAEGAEAFVNLDGDKEVFEVFAKLEPLITVGDMKRLRAYTFNLNPALQSEVIKAATVKSEEENLPKQMA